MDNGICRRVPIVLDEDGIAGGVEFIASPNFDERSTGADIDLIVIHNISLPPNQFGGPGVLQLFTNQLDPNEHPYYREIYQRRVSAHFFIRRSGELIQFVPCSKRAWHAGVSSWQGRERCNDFSIGIELEGTDDCDFEAAQYAILNDLITAIRARYSITDITGHSNIAPDRKTDPGPHFDWEKVKK
ncbi:AmpD protein [Novimethylophilus kurashikiensis]|uniref:1,6-anhydro-N-acetylmuramyl-L-alanine amidase AmpD n=1 Tax=Novimethylophilus kurashikiensis TaxID=1825523 RepID=A0A2R5F610_9PROT|nr:1,6-anhydro-N-acetylmuramyl-L-alanine amidase AmpD [Novimethylophilus kurashikiensis]GBG13565.1 AmpD protein [Novimethylophilus kurashikiensis]